MPISTMIFISALLTSHANTNCVAYALHREASNQSRIVKRAVLDVIENRAKIKRMSMCAVLQQKGQFPYKIKHPTKQMLHEYYVVHKMNHVLSDKYLFFNTIPFKFGKKTKKLGDMYFQQ